MDKGYYTITNDLVTDLMRVGGRGAAPMNNPVYDTLLGIIAYVSRSEGKRDLELSRRLARSWEYPSGGPSRTAAWSNTLKSTSATCSG